MDNPGSFSLGDFGITTAGTFLQPLPVATLQGMRSCALQARFAYGAGGTSVQAYVQTSLDQGQTWVDVACFAFTTSGSVAVANVTDANTAPETVTDGSLANNTASPGVLGDYMRAKVVVTGVYTQSTLLSLWGVAK